MLARVLGKIHRSKQSVSRVEGKGTDRPKPHHDSRMGQGLESTLEYSTMADKQLQKERNRREQERKRRGK